MFKEVLRLHPPSPLLVPHESTTPAVVRGYEIPARTVLFVNGWAIGWDLTAWDAPEEFRPERFVGGGAAADRAPLHERVRLADVVAAGPCHSHLVVGLALREAREHGRLGVLERDRLRHRDQLRLQGSRCNETAYKLELNCMHRPV